MKRNPFFIKHQICGETYLLPFGQGIGEHYRGIKIDETGSLLWDILAEDLSFEEVLACCADTFEASPEELPELEADIRQFLQQMTYFHVFEDPNLLPLTGTICKNLSIAGLNIQLEGPQWAFSSQLDAFLCPKPQKPHMRFQIYQSATPYRMNGVVLLRTDVLQITDCGTWYDLELLENKQLRNLHLTKDASLALAFCEPPYNTTIQEEVFHTLREAFLYLAAQHQMVALHSASILYKDKAWLFSGPSGMGKSTHTNLWTVEFGTPLINGDLNLLALEGDKPMVYGTPWCGTSGIFDAEKHPLGGITLLRRSDHDFVEELSPASRVLLVDQRLVSPSWTKEQFLSNLDFVQKITPEILVCRLNCTKEPRAAYTMKNYIDSNC